MNSEFKCSANERLYADFGKQQNQKSTNIQVFLNPPKLVPMKINESIVLSVTENLNIVVIGLMSIIKQNLRSSTVKIDKETVLNEDKWDKCKTILIPYIQMCFRKYACQS